MQKIYKMTQKKKNHESIFPKYMKFEIIFTVE